MSRGKAKSFAIMLLCTVVARAGPTAAQTYVNFPNPPVVNLSGAAGPNGIYYPKGGTAGGNGNPGQAFTGQLNFSVNGSGGAATVSVASNGGKGGVGGSSGDTGYRGGNGGDGAAGGAVTIRLTPLGNITTSSTQAGLYAATQGGAGGNGGNSGNTGDAGESGRGGAGGAIRLDIDPGQVITSNAVNTPAILLSSNGANGGTSPVTNQTFSTSAVGRKGGDGGSAGGITALIYGAITASGTGVLAVGVGGNGGMGGRAAAQFAKATGGAGGNGGAAGAISLFDLGSINATGAAAPGTGITVPVNGQNVRLSVVGAGMLGESLGGNGAIGGNGGSFVADGGAGGKAADGGSSSVYQYGGSLRTQGYSEAGLFSQSIGGGGGAGSSANGVFSSSGGSGGIAGNGGQAISADEAGFVGTTGAASDALVAQSIGGGGGYGGDVSLISGFVGIVIGGTGAEGGSGSTAIARDGAADTPSGTVLTVGNDSGDLLAQSIGGGGGIGGNAKAVSIGLVSVAVGGSGGKPGNGGGAMAINYGALQSNGDHSDAAVAQSVGGGGGNGGWGSSLTAGAQLTAAASVGGKGETGGTGGQADGYNYGQITTLGEDSAGIVSQSVGGGGGAAGDALATVFQAFNYPNAPSVTVNIALGGNAGNGGIGGQASVANTGAVLTTGDDAVAIQVQSVGGGGGDGGDASSLTQSVQPASVAVTDTVGGNGGKGGTGGPVGANNSGLILTLGEQSPGILEQSIGGGGGDGGVANADTGSVTSGNNRSAQVTLALGGYGGDSGDGGAVTMTSSGGILTRGDASPGILAQSIGGGGGDGAVGKALGSGGTLNANIGVGGSGGGGGFGNTVTITQSGSILTAGGDSPAIIAQSISGGGGDGGEAASGGGTSPVTNAANFLKMGFGIGAGTKDDGNGVVSLLPDAISGLKELATLGKALAGYNSGNTGSTPNPKAGTAKTSISVDVGVGVAGKGGSGGAGNTVNISNSGALQTNGPDSPAILGQSIGGGGGAGGASNPSAGGLIGDASTTSVAIGVGGQGGSAGAGGTVQESNTGSITTLGDISFGIHAQSVGGGGGDGGATIAQNALLNSFSLVLGGNGGNSSSGGAATVNMGQAGAVTTAGNDSIGVLAQSVGGGGGFAYLLGTALSEGGNGQSGTGLANGAFYGGTNSSVKFDGAKGGAGNGGLVTVTLDPTTTSHGQGFIITGGSNAYGVLAQSVGGGGGLILGVPNSGTMLGTLYGGSGTGNGGAVNVTLDNGFYIFNSGSGSAGVVAQSIGGGGGMIGGLNQVDLTSGIETTPKTQNGQAGNVNVTLNKGGNIVTTGFRAHGIIAQALGGGGGVLSQTNQNGYAYAAGSNYKCSGTGCTGNVTVTLNFNTVVRVSGAQAYGIFVESQGNGSNNTTVNINADGFVESWGQSAGGIFVAGAGTNTINNKGTIDDGTLIGKPTASGTAITGFRPANVYNYGIINGSIRLPGASSLTNGVSGVLNTGAEIDLGGGVFENAGTLSPGGAHIVQALTINGSLNDTQNADLLLDISPVSGPSDTVLVTGLTQLSGRVTAQLAPHSALAPGEDKTLVVTTADAPIDENDPLALAGSTPVLTFSFEQPDTSQLDIDTAIDFAPNEKFAAAGLATPNRASVGAALNAVEASAAPLDVDLADAIAEIPTIQGLGQTYDGLSGEAVADAQQVAFSTLQDYAETVAGQIDPWPGAALPGAAGPGAPGPGTPTPGAGAAREPGRVTGWVTGLGSASRLTSDANAALDQQTGGIAVGFESWITPQALMGVSAGGSFTNFEVANLTQQAHANSAYVSLFGLHEMGPVYVSGVLSYSHAALGVTRGNIATLAGIDGVAKGDFGIDLFGGRLEAGRNFWAGPVALTPFAAIEADGLWQDSFAERTPAGATSSAASVALQYADASQISLPMTLGTKAVRRFVLSPQTAVELEGELGWTHNFQALRSLHAAFVESPAVSFHVSGIDAPANAADLDAGIRLVRGGGFSIQAGTSMQLSGGYTSLSGTIELRLALN